MANNNNKNNYVVLKVDDETHKKMINFYKEFARNKQIPYVAMQAVNEDVVITIYEKKSVFMRFLRNSTIHRLIK